MQTDTLTGFLGRIHHATSDGTDRDALTLAVGIAGPRVAIQTLQRDIAAAATAAREEAEAAKNAAAASVEPTLLTQLRAKRADIEAEQERLAATRERAEYAARAALKKGNDDTPHLEEAAAAAKKQKQNAKRLATLDEGIEESRQAWEAARSQAKAEAGRELAEAAQSELHQIEEELAAAVTLKMNRIAELRATIAAGSA